MLPGIKIVFSLQIVQLIVFSDVLYGKEIPFLERQNDYDLTPEWMEMVRHDKQLIPRANIVPFKFNRTCMAINFTFLYNVDAGYDIQLVAQAYKFISNEYRISPIKFQVNFCEALLMNIGGLSALLKCGNFTGCPIKKGIVFHICNFVMDPHKFPPLIPNGRYMIELQFVFRSEELFASRSYVRVDRSIRIP